MDPQTIKNGVELTLTALDAADQVSKLKQVWNRVFAKKTRILILGESGSGKTQFIKSIQRLSGKVEASTVTNTEVRFVLPDGHVVVFIDTPGHMTLKSNRIEAINDLSRKNITGIINVVCNGYQASSKIKSSEVFSIDGTSSKSVKEGYLTENKKREASRVDEWIDKIDRTCKVRWVITLVNKADVWFNGNDQMEDILEDYRNGAYGLKFKAIEQFVQTLYLPYCSIIELFMDSPMMLHMGEVQKMEMHNNLCKTLSSLTNREWR